jgi:hypothetical protein
MRSDIALHWKRQRGPGRRVEVGKNKTPRKGRRPKKATTGDSASAELLLPERNEGLDAPGEVLGP